MSRPLRIEYEGAYYHVMNRGLPGQSTFIHEKDYRHFIYFLEDIHRRWSAEIYSFCCMSNHYHLVLQTSEGNLSRIMRHINSLYTQEFNRAHQREGPLFRGRYKAQVVDAESYLLEVVRYVHLNPVRAGMVAEAAEYPCSSHRMYLMDKEQQPQWINTREVLEYYSSRQSFDDYVSEGDGVALLKKMKLKRKKPILGDKTFIKRIMKGIRKSPEHSRLESTPQFQNCDDIIQQVSEKMDVSVHEMIKGIRGRRNAARNIAIYIASRIAGFSHRDIQVSFCIKSDSGISRVCQRVTSRLAVDRLLSKNIKRILE